MTFTVTLAGGTPTEIYAGDTFIDKYVNEKIGAGAKKYRALPANGDDRKRLMIEATRLIDALAWQGAPSFAGSTTLQYPRTGLTNSDGTTVSDADQLALVAKVVGELVALAAADPDVVAAADAGSNLRGLGAGSARVDFFRPTSFQDGNATLLPVPVQRLIGKWLAIASASVSAAAAPVSTGTNSCSDFDACDELKVTGPL
jgi:hypothetical protein